MAGRAYFRCRCGQTTLYTELGERVSGECPNCGPMFAVEWKVNTYPEADLIHDGQLHYDVRSGVHVEFRGRRSARFMVHKAARQIGWRLMLHTRSVGQRLYEWGSGWRG